MLLDYFESRVDYFESFSSVIKLYRVGALTREANDSDESVNDSPSWIQVNPILIWTSHFLNLNIKFNQLNHNLNKKQSPKKYKKVAYPSPSHPLSFCWCRTKPPMLQRRCSDSEVVSSLSLHMFLYISPPVSLIQSPYYICFFVF